MGNAEYMGSTQSTWQETSRTKEDVVCSNAEGILATTGKQVGNHPCGSKEWKQEVKGVLNEAKQCGVSPTVIDHARLAMREKMHEMEEQARARKALERSLSKRDVNPQEVR